MKIKFFISLQSNIPASSLPGSSIGVDVNVFCQRKLFFKMPRVFIARLDM